MNGTETSFSQQPGVPRHLPVSDAGRKPRIMDLNGQHVPVVAFYSVQGGVGKSTLSLKFAELVTLAPGRDGRKPNVLLVDLDTGSHGNTVRLEALARQNFGTFRTVHEMFAERNAAAAQAINVSAAVRLAGGDMQQRGQLYLMPAARPDARKLFDTMASIPPQELFALLVDAVQALVEQYAISCVVIDCAPSDNPYSAAAAALADIPLYIGRNEPPSYEGIHRLPERFREWFPSFQPAMQRVIVNGVTVKELFDKRAENYAIADYIPLTTDVIHETEGLPQVGSLRMLLFEKYVVDIIQQVFVGMGHLIPEAPEVLGPEWLEGLRRLQRAESAPEVRRLAVVARLRWAGAALVLAGLAVWVLRQALDDFPAAVERWGMLGAVAGAVLFAVGWYAESRRARLLRAARELVDSGPDEVFRRLQEGMSHRQALDEMKRLAETIPPPPPPQAVLVPIARH